MIAELIASLYDVSLPGQRPDPADRPAALPAGRDRAGAEGCGALSGRGAARGHRRLPQSGSFSAFAPGAAPASAGPDARRREPDQALRRRGGGERRFAFGRARHGACAHRPERGGQVHAHQLRQRSLPRRLRSHSAGRQRRIPTCRRMRGRRMGLARTFQNLQLVNSLTVHGEPAARRSLARDPSLADFSSWLLSDAFEAEERARALDILRAIRHGASGGGPPRGPALRASQARGAGARHRRGADRHAARRAGRGPQRPGGAGDLRASSAAFATAARRSCWSSTTWTSS